MYAATHEVLSRINQNCLRVLKQILNNSLIISDNQDHNTVTQFCVRNGSSSSILINFGDSLSTFCVVLEMFCLFVCLFVILYGNFFPFPIKKSD